MAEPTAGVTAVSPPPWLHPNHLLAFVDELRDADFNIGVAQYVAVQDLLLALLARGEPLDDPTRLKSFIGPIVCGSPSEQADFSSRFDGWIERMGWQTAVSTPTTPLADELRQLEATSQRWILWVIAAIFGFLLVFAIFVLLGPQMGAVPINPSLPTTTTITLPNFLNTQVLLMMFLLPFLLYLGWRMWRRNQARLFLERRAVNHEPRIEQVSVAGLHESLFPKVHFYRMAQQFRRRIERPSHRLDVAATVQATVQQGGWFTPIYGRTQIPPEYLILIDRAAYGDHQAELVDAMLQRLGENEVFLSRYYFDGDPRLCFPANSSRPLTLRNLMAQHAGHRLLLFTDAARFFHPLTGEAEQWLELFDFWPERAILTPEPTPHWGAVEQALARHFMLLPASMDGLTAYIAALQQEDVAASVGADGQTPYPLLLRRQPYQWLDREAPDGEEVAEMLTAVRQYLGDEAYTWLAACAIYPELHWNLTLYLGQSLTDANGEPLLTAERMAALARLPWFRRSFMPDWLRTELIMKMPRAQEQTARAVLQALLLTAVEGDIGSFKLEIAQEYGRSLTALARPVIRRLARTVPADHPLKDYVFLSFMSGRKPKPLSVRLPEAMRRLFGRSQTRQPQFRTGPWVLVNLFSAAIPALILWWVVQQSFYLNANLDQVGYLLPLLHGVLYGLVVGGMQADYLANCRLIYKRDQGRWWRWNFLGWSVGAFLAYTLTDIVQSIVPRIATDPVAAGMVQGVILGSIVGLAGWQVLRREYDPVLYHNPIAWVSVSILSFTFIGGLYNYWLQISDVLGVPTELNLFVYAILFAVVVGVGASGALAYIRKDYPSQLRQIEHQVHFPALYGRTFLLRWIGLTTLAYTLAYGVGQLFTLASATETISWLLQGLVLGGFVGVVQGPLLRPYGISRRFWFLTTLVGLLPAIYITENIGTTSGLVAGALVGLLLGLTQWAVLRTQVRHAGYWLMITLIGWAIANSFANMIGDYFTTTPLFMALARGLVIGLVYADITSFVIQWLLQMPLPEAQRGWHSPTLLRRLDRWINGILRPQSLAPTWQLWLKWTLVSAIALNVGGGLSITALILILITGTATTNDPVFIVSISGAGLITGLMLAYAQWRYLLRLQLPSSGFWTLANGLAWAIGIGTAFSRLSATGGIATGELNFYLTIGGFVGLAVAIAQWVVLRRTVTGVRQKYIGVWVPATTVIWVTAWLMGYFVTDLFFSPVDDSLYSLVFLAVVTGLVYGALSGLLLLWLEGWQWRTTRQWLQSHTSPDVPPTPNRTFVLLWMGLSVAALYTAVFLIYLYPNDPLSLVVDNIDWGYLVTLGIGVTIVNFIIAISQRILLRQYRSGWLSATTIGGSVGVIAGCVTLFLMLRNTAVLTNLKSLEPFLLMLVGGLYGLAVGGWQWRILRRHVYHAGLWPLANLLIWTVTGLLFGLIGSDPSGWPVYLGLSIYLFAIFGATGLVMRRLIQHPKPEQGLAEATAVNTPTTPRNNNRLWTILVLLILLASRVGLALLNVMGLNTLPGYLYWGGMIFFPWTAFTYLLAAPGGITGFNWLFLGIALLVDLSVLGFFGLMFYFIVTSGANTNTNKENASEASNDSNKK
jgi:hypothetical protein